MTYKCGVGRALLPQLRALIPGRLKDQLKTAAGCPSMETSLRNMRDRCGFTPHVAVDVGAHRGEWTRMCRSIFPHVSILAIEPLHACADDLASLANAHPDIHVRQALLGAVEGQAVSFHENETTSSVLPERGNASGRTRDLSLTTLDVLAAGTVFAAPDFLKLDVQGYELEVLKGASVALGSVEVVVMELNLIDVNIGAPLMQEACQFMAERGYRLYDICTLYRRPLDGALWQVDGIFVSSQSSLLRSSAWDTPS